jgi:hypothetical protein
MCDLDSNRFSANRTDVTSVLPTTAPQQGDMEVELLGKITALLNGSGAKIGGNTKTVDVTFVLDTSIYASGDVLSDRVAIAACMRVNDGTGVLSGFTLHDEDDQGIELDVVFLSADVAVGTINNGPSITDANARNILGIVNVAADDWIDLGGVRIATKLNVNLPVKPATGTDDIYVALITRGTPTHTASGLRGRFHFFQD